MVNEHHSHTDEHEDEPGHDHAAHSRNASLRETRLSVAGMNCAGCARSVTDALRAVPGVADALVELSANSASVRWKPDGYEDREALVQAVTEAGYHATVQEDEHCHSEPGGSFFETWKFNVIFGAVLTLPLIIGEWAFQLGMNPTFQWVGLSLSAPVVFVCGLRFFRGAWKQIQRGQSNMDTLVALGSSTAFAYSTWVVFSGAHTHAYFMEAAAIITLISTGHWMESIVSAKAASSLKALLQLAPATARKRNADGSETEVPVAALQLRDTIVLKPGDRVPTDAEVSEGNSAVDESMLTGESLPVEKSVGAKLYGGTVNQNGRLLARVTALGETTALAQIIAVVQRAQNSRANIQKLGDQVSSVFVPIVVVIAILSGLWWGLGFEHALGVGKFLSQYLWSVHWPETALASAFIHAAGVLIVACPCAMGLATPVAIMAGTNVAARRGILIRDGAALEKSGTVTAVLFDKTGTLTEGKVSVAAEEAYTTNKIAVKMRPLAAALAHPSNHPLSRAVAKLANDVERTSVSDWQEKRGQGVVAQSNGAIVRLGSLNWLRECGVELARAQKFIDDWSQRGATILGVAADTELVGVLALRDTLKADAGKVIAQLRQTGTKAFLVTGDHTTTAKAIATQAGIPAENVFAEVRPERKAEIVQQLQSRGERVAFVGDGINDAPALEQADLGIAVAKASDVAREAADIILLKSDIHAIPEAIGLAQATLRTIKQNLFWAFFYNAAGIPLAALGFLSPVICAAAMGFSDLIVIGNALRLRNWKAK